MRDHYRPLLVFEGGDARGAEQQLEMLAAHTEAMRNRQVLVVGTEGTDKSVPTAMLSAKEWQAARQRFGNKTGDFTVTLLGKDGSEKLRSHRPISWEQLQSTIDSMPMRKEDMRKARQ